MASPTGHPDKDSLSVMVVNPSQIYLRANEAASQEEWV